MGYLLLHVKVNILQEDFAPKAKKNIGGGTGVNIDSIVVQESMLTAIAQHWGKAVESMQLYVESSVK